MLLAASLVGNIRFSCAQRYLGHPELVQEIKKVRPVDKNMLQAKFIVQVARYSFSGSIPLKFEHKLRRQKQNFGKIATTVVLDKDENLL